MNAVLCLLLVCGASGHASRSLDVPGQTIAGVTWQIGRGMLEGKKGTDPQQMLATLQSLVISVDGQTVTGWRGYTRASLRVLGYVLEVGHAGRVELWRADRYYTIEDGRVAVSVNRTVYERVQRRTIAICVCVKITATQTTFGTQFDALASGTKRGCIGGRAISRGLSAALGEIAAAGQQAYGRGPEPANLADRVLQRFGR